MVNGSSKENGNEISQQSKIVTPSLTKLRVTISFYLIIVTRLFSNRH